MGFHFICAPNPATCDSDSAKQDEIHPMSQFGVTTKYPNRAEMKVKISIDR
jgi:hypothetical protein